MSVLEVELAVKIHAEILKEGSILTEEWVVPVASMLHEESSMRGAAQEAILVVVERGGLGVLLGDDTVERAVVDMHILLEVGEEFRVAASALLILVKI